MHVLFRSVHMWNKKRDLRSCSSAASGLGSAAGGPDHYRLDMWIHSSQARYGIQCETIGDFFCGCGMVSFIVEERTR